MCLTHCTPSPPRSWQCRAQDGCTWGPAVWVARETHGPSLEAYRLPGSPGMRLWGGVPLGSLGLSWLGLGHLGFLLPVACLWPRAGPQASVSPYCRRGREGWVSGSRVLDGAGRVLRNDRYHCCHQTL